MILGKVMRKIRKQKGLKSYQLANKVGVSPSFITEVEKGRNYPSPRVMKKICIALRYDFTGVYFKEKYPDLLDLFKIRIG